MPRQFKWEGHSRVTSLEEYKQRSPFLATHYDPTVYNPDKSRLYLGALDVDVDTDDYPRIEELLGEVTASFVKEYEALARTVVKQKEEMAEAILLSRQHPGVRLPDCGDYRRAQLKADMDELSWLLGQKPDE